MLLILMAITLTVTVALDPIPFTYKKVGNLSIEAIVYLPSPANLFPKYPVIMGIHGGGYVVGNYYTYFHPEIEGITSRGWCIVSINYRLSPGVLLQDIMEDVTDAYNWIRNDLSNSVPINPDIIVVWGSSAGGALALIAGYKLIPRPQAIVSFDSYYANFTDPSVYDSTQPVSETLINLANNIRTPILTGYINAPDNLNNTRVQLFLQARAENKTGWFLTTVNPDESPENITAMLKEYSVVYNIDEEYPPTYLIHGMLDNTVPYTQSVQAADQLEKYNVPYKLILMPNLGHGTEQAFAEHWSQNMEPLLEFVEEEVGIRSSIFKRHIVLVVVSIVIIISSICLYKKLRQKKGYVNLENAGQECISATDNVKDGSTNTGPESLNPEGGQIILQLPK